MTQEKKCIYCEKNEKDCEPWCERIKSSRRGKILQDIFKKANTKTAPSNLCF